MSSNAIYLDEEVRYLSRVLKQRIEASVRSRISSPPAQPRELKLPVYSDNDSTLARFLNERQLTFEERAMFSLALSLHVSPFILNKHCIDEGKVVADFGTLRGKNTISLLPTGLTWLFVVAGKNNQRRMLAMESLKNNQLIRDNIIVMDNGFAAEPYLNGAMYLNHETLFSILTNSPIQELIPH